MVFLNIFFNLFRDLDFAFNLELMNLGFHVSNMGFHALNRDCYGSSNLIFDLFFGF